jgi:hypothetical protein
VIATFGLAFGGRPIRRTRPAAGADISGAASGSEVMPLAIAASSLAFGRMSFSLIESHLAAVGLAGRDDAPVAVPFDEHDYVEPATKRSYRNQARLSIVSPPVFENQRAIPIQIDKIAKIDRVICNVRQAFIFVPSMHIFVTAISRLVNNLCRDNKSVTEACPCLFRRPISIVFR